MSIPSASRESPYPGSWSVRQALHAYWAENGFDETAYTDKWTPVSFFGLHFSIPNTKSHQRALRLHDLHHVATGYGTDLVGEGEISVLEVRRDLSKVGLYVAVIIASVAFTGIFISPRRMLAAFRETHDSACLWALDVPYEELLEMSVADLRALLRLPPDGIAQGRRGLHERAPAAEVSVAG
jgi:hypothetical protein